jgi:hypothetical protein
MGAPFGYANAGSLDMSWLPLSRFESRVVCVAVCGLGARGEGAAQISVEIRLGVYWQGRGWAHCPGMQINVDSLDMSWLPLPKFESRVVCVVVPGQGHGGEVAAKAEPKADSTVT